MQKLRCFRSKVFFVSSFLFTACNPFGDTPIAQPGFLKAFTVTISSTNASTSASSSESISSGATLGVTVTANAGYTLSASVSGTCPAGSWSGSVYTTGAITADCTLGFSGTVTGNTVTYSGNGNTGGTVPTDVSSPYSSSSTVTVLGNTGALTKTGYTFSGWNTAANGSGTSYAAAATFSIAAATTLYAQYSINSYTVTYDGNGNTGGSAPTDGSSPYNYGVTVTVLGNTGALTKTGYVFSNWNTASDGSGTTYAPSATFTLGAANKTLYANYGRTYQIFVTSSAYFGDLKQGYGTAAEGADANCASDAQHPDSGKTWEALIVDGVSRRACSTANCSGTGEGIDWVLKPNTIYTQPDGTTIGTTGAKGIFDFSTPLTNPISSGAETVLTGLQSDWRVSSDTCQNWTSTNSADSAASGDGSATDQNAINTTTAACDAASWALYCVEQ